MEDEENQAGANSEMRFITLELMKLAQKSGRSFGQVAQEFVENTCGLQELIASGPQRHSRARRAACTRQK